jgi:hypothetical protein
VGFFGKYDEEVGVCWRLDYAYDGLCLVGLISSQI